MCWIMARSRSPASSGALPARAQALLRGAGQVVSFAWDSVAGIGLGTCWGLVGAQCGLGSGHNWQWEASCLCLPPSLLPDLACVWRELIHGPSRVRRDLGCHLGTLDKELESPK